jgi:V8-like Glu-specific endopeptidase
VTVSTFIGLATWLPAAASPSAGLRSGATTNSRGSGGPAGTYVVSAAAQRSAIAFWTPPRMTAATGATGATGAGHAARAGITPDVPEALIAPRGTPTAAKFTGVATVGVLFYTTGSKNHFCTASVIDSTPRDIVLTAAHCVYSAGYATNLAYVPEYHAGTRPLGTWAVRAITIAAGWRSTHNPDLDFAFLATAPRDGKHVQAVTGGLNLGLGSAYAQSINVIGYNDTDDLPVRCQTRSFEFRPGQQEFYCHDYRGGTSGGPWITDLNPRTGAGVVHGVIGGYEQGGDYEWASYSAYFGARFEALYKEAAG